MDAIKVLMTTLRKQGFQCLCTLCLYSASVGLIRVWFRSDTEKSRIPNIPGVNFTCYEETLFGSIFKDHLKHGITMDFMQFKFLKSSSFGICRFVFKFCFLNVIEMAKEFYVQVSLM